MGYQPRTPYYEMYEQSRKEVHQLQEANNELTAELYRLKELERMGGTDALTQDREAIEDYLWNSQQDLAMEVSRIKGLFSITAIAAPATAALVWGVVASDHIVLVIFLATLSAILGLLTLALIGVIIGKIVDEVPRAKRLVARNERDLNRATIKEMGLS